MPRNLTLLMGALALIVTLLIITVPDATGGPPVAGGIPIAAPPAGNAVPLNPDGTVAGPPIQFWTDVFGQFHWGNNILHPKPGVVPAGHVMTNQLANGEPPPPPQVEIDVRFFADDTDPDGPPWAVVTMTPPGTSTTYRIQR